jgi:hypothetical protein
MTEYAPWLPSIVNMRDMSLEEATYWAARALYGADKALAILTEMEEARAVNAR